MSSAVTVAMYIPCNQTSAEARMDRKQSFAVCSQLWAIHVPILLSA